MITAPLKKMLIEQIGNELNAQQNYVGIALYFEARSLDKWGKLFREQADEEGGHGRKIMDFLIDCEVDFDLPAIKPAKTKFESAEKAVALALKGEQNFGTLFKNMAAAALKQNDFTAFQFLQWFIDEQVEEVAKMQKIVDLVKSGINLFQAESLLESFS